MKILFVDDEPHRLELLQSRNFFSNHEVSTASNALEAFSAIGRESWDIVFLDHDLQTFLEPIENELTGVDVVKCMVETIADKKPFCVIHSLNSAGADRMHKILEDAGFTSHVVPFTSLPRLVRLKEM